MGLLWQNNGSGDPSEIVGSIRFKVTIPEEVIVQLEELSDGMEASKNNRNQVVVIC